MIKEFVDKCYPRFGENKRQEITRLLYEIAKREGIEFREIIKDCPPELSRFNGLKDYLLKRRFPRSTANDQKIRCLLPKLEINPRFKVNVKIEKKGFNPKHVYIEEAAVQSYLTGRMKEMFPHAKFETILSYKKYIQNQQYSLEDYNDRLDHCFLTKERFDFFKRCPCTPKAAPCGYHLINLGIGCAYECTYCFLPAYLNSPGIVFPTNIDDFFDKFKEYPHNIRIGSGEFTDSLVFDHITQYSPQIVEFFKSYPKATFEFKTKSINVDLLTSIKSGGNIVVSWTVNPPAVANAIENLAPPVEERLKAAVQCQASGYRIGFHFDPIVYYDGWENDYQWLVNQIFENIDAKNIAWISLGTLRMTQMLKKTIENRFPGNTILDEELFTGYDDKIRYDLAVRKDIYDKMTRWIRQRNRNVFVYLCMEDAKLNNEILKQ